MDNRTLEEVRKNEDRLINELEQLQQENKQLKEQLLATQTNEETFRLEMEDITRILGLDEDTIFDDVKTYARSLKENKILRENAEHNDKVVDKVNWENQKLKKQIDEYKLITIDYQDLEAKNQKLKKQLEEANEKILLLQASEPMLEYKKALEENQQKEFIDYLENEKYRLAGECSPTYEGSLGKKRFVNEDIFNEVDKILSKYYEIIEK